MGSQKRGPFFHHYVTCLVIGLPLYCGCSWKLAILLHLGAVVLWLFLNWIFCDWGNLEMGLFVFLVAANVSVLALHWHKRSVRYTVGVAVAALLIFLWREGRQPAPPYIALRDRRRRLFERLGRAVSSSDLVGSRAPREIVVLQTDTTPTTEYWAVRDETWEVEWPLDDERVKVKHAVLISDLTSFWLSDAELHRRFGYKVSR